jgi:RNA polymerase sigma-70 factor (ECF subfamily)
VAVLGGETGQGCGEPSNDHDDVDQFERLYRLWWPDVVVLCRRALARPGDAEDAAQEVFLRAWMARDRYLFSKPFWPWVAAIARRLCVDWHRRGGREVLNDTLTDMTAGELTPERIVLAEDQLHSVFQALDGLRVPERLALVLREFRGWSYEEIADVQGVSVESVRGSLKRARAALRRSVLHDDVFGTVRRRILVTELRADDQEQPPLARLSSMRSTSP